MITTLAAQDAAAQTDRLELELVADAGHFIVDEKPELVADRLLGLLSVGDRFSGYLAPGAWEERAHDHAGQGKSIAARGPARCWRDY